MERNVMGELNVYRGSGAKPNFSEIARRHGMDRHTVAKYWREGEAAADGRSARGSAFDPLEEVIRAKAQLPGMTKMAVYAFLREGRGEGLPGYGAFTAWCRARDVPFGGVGGREPHPRFETPPGRQLQGGVPGADAPARGQEARGRLGARGGQARGEGQPGEGGVHIGNQREVHLDAGEGPKGAQAHKEGLRGMGRGRTSARLGQASLRGRAQNGF